MRRATQIGLLLVAALAVVGVWVLAWQNVTRVPVSTGTDYEPAPVEETTAEPTLPPLDVPADSRVVFLGDSWSAGYAVEEAQSYPFVLGQQQGWTVSVIPNGGGTGYLNPGPPDTGTYGERLATQDVDATVDLVVIQGGLNDAALPDRAMTGDLNRAVGDVIQSAGRLYPEAQLLMVGPLNPLDTLPGPVISQIDDRLASVARDERVPYVSPTDDGWFSTDSDVTRYISAEADDHPSLAGHKYLAQRLATSIEALS